MPEIRVILTENEYHKALQEKGERLWREILLNALDLEPEKRRKGRPHAQMSSKKREMV